MDLETSLRLLKQEGVSIATIEYPSIGDGKISTLSRGTKSPHYSIRETGVGSMSHMSTYIQLVNAMMDIQRFFTKGISSKWPTLVGDPFIFSPAAKNGTIQTCSLSIKYSGL